MELSDVYKSFQGNLLKTMVRWIEEEEKCFTLCPHCAAGGKFTYLVCISSLIAPSKLSQTFIYILLDSRRIVKHSGAEPGGEMETSG